MAGRKKETIEVLQAKGKKHLTKLEIEQRKANQIKVNDNKVYPSINLPEELHERFYYYSEEMKNVGIISNLDIGALERYCILEKEFYEISKSIESINKNNFRYKEKKKDLLDTNKAMISLENSLGLNMLSRNKLVPQKPKEEKPKNKFERFVK